MKLYNQVKSGIVRMCGIMLTLSAMTFAASAPSAVAPVPSANQLAWQKAELLLFTHFGLQTFTGTNNANGNPVDTTLFNPVGFNPAEWVSAAQAGGFKGIVLICKHNEGYCNWQTATTRYSVVSAPWLAGKGDIVKGIAAAFHAAGLRFGVYLSVWDQHYKHWASAAEKAAYPTYALYYEAQLRECLSNYGTVDEVWFDGNGSDSMSLTTADWQNIYSEVTTLQPGCVAFQGFWPSDTHHIQLRWPGDEAGDAGDPDWAFFPVPGTGMVVSDTAHWQPQEADVTLQGLWFYNNTPIETASQIESIYLTSVGRAGVGLYNVAPNPTGLIDSASIKVLGQFNGWVDSIYAMNLSPGATAQASSVLGGDTADFGPGQAIDTGYNTYWAPDSFAYNHPDTLTVTLPRLDTLRMFVLQEYIPLGQRVGAFNIQTYNGTKWTTSFSGGTTIGYKRIIQLSSPVPASRARLIITQSRPTPLINNFELIGNHIVTAAGVVHQETRIEAPSEVKITASGNGKIYCSGLKPGAVSLELFSLSGKKINLIGSGSEAGIAEFYLPSHVPGIYFLRARVNGIEAARQTLFLP
jgi:alpha-L-fucosidase